MEKRLRQKFVFVAMLSVAAALALILVVINAVNYQSVCRMADDRIEAIVENGGSFPGVFGADGAQDGQGETSDTSVVILEELSATYIDRSYGLGKRAADIMDKEAPYDTRYFTVTVNGDGTIAGVDVNHVAATTAQDACTYALQVSTKSAKHGFYGAYRYRVVDTDEGSLYVFVDCSRELSNFEAFLGASAAIGMGAWLLVFILMVIFSRVAVRPIVESYRKQQRFITDASHEIKTPLAVISAANDVLEIEAGESEWTQSIAAQVTRLKSLTERLVFLARMDEGATQFEKTDLDLSELAEYASEPFCAVAESRGKKLVRDLESGLHVQGDISALSQVVELLLDNATRYASDGSEIELALKKRSRGGVTLQVSNAVDAMPEGDLKRLFDRFYRADTSRNSQTGGSGVGLSVAQAIVEAHGGSIRAQALDAHTICFTVTLP